ncbi:MAG: DUF2017 family protein [Acidimicrobiales bacterium]|nr:DUF2017 family protein [Acidimicrobiales bacterium]
MGLFSRPQRVRRADAGRYRLDLPAEERALVADLCGQLRALLTETTDDPSLRRLFPTAYHDDVERDREYQQLVRDELLDRRLSALDTVQATHDATEVDAAQLGTWMRALNDLRLVIGTRLDVSEDALELDADDPDAPAHAVYGYLSYLLGEVVDALGTGLGDPDPEADAGPGARFEG